MATATKIRRVVSTDRSVRDHTQKAVVMPNIICVQSFVGRVKVSEYNIGQSDWYNLNHYPSANPIWNKVDFIRQHTRSYDSEPGGPCQAERIRDSQRMAIDEGIEMWKDITGG